MRGQHARRQRLAASRRHRRAAAPARGRARARSPARGSAARPQQHRLVKAADDGGFDPDRDRPAVDDQVDPPGEVALHMRGGGRRDMAGADWPTAPPPARRSARRMARATGWAGTRIATVSSPAVARSATAQSRGFRQHQRQRPRPERLGQPQRGGVEPADLPGGGEIADMGDQRIEGRPALGLVEPRDRRGIGGVGAEAVDGLGRERDQPALAQAVTRAAATAASPAARIWRCSRRTFISGSSSQFGFLRCAKPKAISRASCRSVAQPGRALRSGRRGRRFKSCHSDQDFIRFFRLISPLGQAGRETG